jgi:hypothetical protein
MASFNSNQIRLTFHCCEELGQQTDREPDKDVQWQQSQQQGSEQQNRDYHKPLQQQASDQPEQRTLG